MEDLNVVYLMKAAFNMFEKYFDEMVFHESLRQVLASNKDINLFGSEIKAWIDMVEAANDCYLLTISYNDYAGKNYKYLRKQGFISNDNSLFFQFIDILGRINSLTNDYLHERILEGVLQQKDVDFLKAILHGCNSFTEKESGFSAEIRSLLIIADNCYIDSIYYKVS